MGLDVRNQEDADANQERGMELNRKRKRALRYAARFMSIRQRGSATVHPRKERLRSSKGRSVGCGCLSGNPVMSNYANFDKSGVPKRVMVFQHGEWVDLPNDSVSLLADAFSSRKSATEVVIDEQMYVVDFLQMFCINLNNGLHEAIGWIDDDDRCFFPKSFCDSGMKWKGSSKVEVNLDIDISNADSSNSGHEADESLKIGDGSGMQNYRAKILDVENKNGSGLEQGSAGSGNSCVEKHILCEKGPLIPSGGESRNVLPPTSHVIENLGSATLGNKLFAMEKDSAEYIDVNNMFLIGLGTFITASHIVGIYRCNPANPSAQAHSQLFQNQIKITANLRGSANVRYAWHGTSRETIAGLMLHGFGKIQKPAYGVAYGNGVHLAAKECAHISAVDTDVDENGVQHMVLCRVIMGNAEQVHPCSEQSFPTSENFDSGVDDVNNPKRYVIWGSHMNTNILPEYVVSFKAPPRVREYWIGLRQSQSKHVIGAGPAFSIPDGCATGISPMGLVSSGGLSEQPNEAFQKVPSGLAKGVKLPTSAWVPLQRLYVELKKIVSHIDQELLDCYFVEFKEKRLSREELVKRLRLIVGDDVLRSILQSFWKNVTVTSNANINPNASKVLPS